MRTMAENTLMQSLLLCAICALSGACFLEATALSGERARAVRERTQTARLRAASWFLIAAFLTTALAFVAGRGRNGAIETIVVWVRVGLLLLMLALLRARAVAAASSLAAAALLATQSALSRSAEHDVLALFGDWLHLTLAACWLGGVLMLGVVAGALAHDPDAAAVRSYGAVIDRFSPVALFCVAGLALGGIAQSAQFLGSVEALWTTDYGRALSAKLALFAVLVGFGAFHRQVLAPQVRRWALRRSEAGDGRGFVLRFRLSLSIEVIVGALLLAMVGVMKALPM
jgi:copper transport protein